MLIFILCVIICTIMCLPSIIWYTHKKKKIKKILEKNEWRFNDD